MNHNYNEKAFYLCLININGGGGGKVVFLISLQQYFILF